MLFVELAPFAQDQCTSQLDALDNEADEALAVVSGNPIPFLRL